MQPTRRTSTRRGSIIILAVGILGLVGVRTTQAQSADAARGTAEFNRGEFAAARADFEAVLRRNPSDARALFFLGKIALQQDRPADAIDLLEQAIGIDDRNAEYHAWLGNAVGMQAVRASRFKLPFLANRAKGEYERAVALDPRSTEGRMGLLQYYALAPRMLGGGMDKAREQASELVRFNPYAGHLSLAWLAQRDKDVAAAEREYVLLLAIAPDSAPAYRALGSIYQSEERWNDAFAVYERRAARQPDDMANTFQLGRVAALSGTHLERGEQALKLWIESAPKDAPIATISGAHHRLGQIYEKQGHRDAARAEYEMAVRINDGNEDAKKSLASLRSISPTS
jgi:tetratricopeptide (TPR) repeat protein